MTQLFYLGPSSQISQYQMPVKHLKFISEYHSSTNTSTKYTHTSVSRPRWAGTRKVKQMWILLKQETVSGSGISWAVYKYAPHSRQITVPAPHHSLFTGRMPFLPPKQQRQSTEGKSAKYYNTIVWTETNQSTLLLLLLLLLIECTSSRHRVRLASVTDLRRELRVWTLDRGSASVVPKISTIRYEMLF